ncbi:hypothetical protein GUJ93_ZPchr0004g40403 [Zizania palustris]|uniref:Pentatricopeptide repeat-containing protein n=1 Tax=Zizania palustris TaxID=103762 RepID=A0A8J5VG91_ZIZPA|nr:hypothetical protein GUJ93_ZPchr0004g40403 [Zizania palustris]
MYMKRGDLHNAESVFCLIAERDIVSWISMIITKARQFFDELAAKHLCELDSLDSGSYVLLAKIYSDAGKSEDSAEVRKLMRDKGVKKK